MSRYNRDRSPDFAAGGSGIPPRVPSPGHTTFIPFPAADQHARLEYAPQAPPYYQPPPNTANLQIPDNSRARPRSLPPPVEYRRSRSRQERDRDWDRGRYDDDDDDDDDRDRDNDKRRDRTPVGKAKQFLDNNFTDSTTGLGVGVLGALVGGLAAHEAADATSKGHHGNRDAHRRSQLLSTVVGAAVGALGANAVEKRLENNREKTRDKQDRWEQKWGKTPGGRVDITERREVVTRPRSGGGRRDREYDDRRPGSRGGREREVDPDARSWKNVEDWVYDERDQDRRGRRSGDGYRY